MFGHQLADRHQKGEDIFYFCFYMLEFLTSEEFSLASISARARFDRSRLLAGSASFWLTHSLSLSLFCSSENDKQQQQQQQQQQQSAPISFDAQMPRSDMVNVRW
mgnify:CR=1 FL=1